MNFSVYQGDAVNDGSNSNFDTSGLANLKGRKYSLATRKLLTSLECGRRKKKIEKGIN